MSKIKTKAEFANRVRYKTDKIGIFVMTTFSLSWPIMLDASGVM